MEASVMVSALKSRISKILPFLAAFLLFSRVGFTRIPVRIRRGSMNALLALMLACRLAAFAEGAAGKYTVEGECIVSREGELFIYATGEGDFASPQKGSCEAMLQVGPAEARAGKVCFSFCLPAGRYGIRCFLDLNGNGRLDRGLLGPTEPWGMSWGNECRSGFPRFDDIAFVVDRDIKGIRIEVRR
jgi:uncharacterized protein (DUF2141 family)